MRLFYRIKEFFNYDIRWLKWWCQRAKRGFSDRDVWSIDYYLNSILPKMLRQLKETTHGYPGSVQGFKTWQNLLERMALGFEASDRITDAKNWVMNDDNEFYVENTFFEETNPWTPEQVKSFRELDRRDMRTFKQGMNLFTKYYHSLWD